MEYLYWLLACAAYLALIRGLPRVLPEATYPLLRWLHWGTSVLCLLALVVPILTMGNWMFRSLGLFSGVLLVSGLLAGIRRQLGVASVPVLATMQAVLVGLAAFPLLGLSLGSTSPDVAYKDGSYTVTVKEHFSLMDYDPGPPNIELYRVRLGFFNEYLGHIARNQTQETVPTLKAWWRAVSAVSFEADSNRGVAWHSGTAVPFEVNPPYHGGDGDKLPRAAEPAYQPTPAPPGADISEPDRVYTYVEEMPHLPGTVGLAPVVEAVEERLVVPPHTPEGRLFVELTVAETGDVQEVRILKGLNSSVDSAVLTAVRRLPRFEPGRQNGRPVKVSLTMPIPVVHRYPRKLHPHRSHAKPRPTPPPDWPDLLAPG